jgi:hypothetical protein
MATDANEAIAAGLLVVHGDRIEVRSRRRLGETVLGKRKRTANYLAGRFTRKTRKP